MATKYHMCIAVRPQLRGSDEQLQRRWTGAITTDDGKVLIRGSEIRTFWEDQLVQGHEVIPWGESDVCDNFDYKKGGCLGHPVPEKVGANGV